MKKRFLLSLSLSLSLAVSSLHAEDNGFFVSAGYQIGEAVQMVKNTGELKNLNDKYEQLNSSLAQVAALRQSIKNANNYELVKQSISNLISFANNNSQNKDLSPIYSSAQAVLTSILAFWTLYAGNALTFNVEGLPTSTSQNGQGFSNVPLTAKCSKPDSKNCMPIATYQKMKNLAESLQKAQGTLCALNENGCNTANQDQGATISSALNTAKELMDLISATNTNMDWSKIKINGLLVPSEVRGDRNGSITKYEGKITSNNSVTSYALFQNIYKMLPYLQESLKLSEQNKSKSDGLQGQVTGDNTNPNYDKEIYNFAQNQQTILSNAKSIFNLFNSIPKDQFEYLQVGYLKIPPLGTTPTKPYRKNVNLNAEIDSIQRNVAYYGNRIDSALSVARDVYNLKSNQASIVAAYSNAKNLSQEISKLPYNQVNTKDIVTLPYDKNAPAAGQYNYQINQEQASNLSQALAAMSNNPFKNIGMIASQSNNGALNGLGVQVGYKQFFGESKRWGLRYYGFFDYNHGYIKSSFFNSSSDIWTYGGGSDLLVNFINDSVTRKNNKLSVGLFGGIQLAGTTWLNSQYVNLTALNNPYSAKVNTSNFQFLFNLGLRSNLATAKKEDSEHSAQHGIELGIKIPTINTNYYSFLGAKLEYRRLYSVYLNYVFAY
ncbi:outer membrane protein [Helicobacter pylori]|uniref:Hop family adhesin SabA n=1 Tax=Helicobacter pylori TaxID=210 RepID=UPI001FCFE2AD|nr:outer membrane protein [Helicobacter pylori]UOR64331.1 outer membrane protein [Helicobacter pylori]